MSSQKYIRSITEIVPDEMPNLTPLPEPETSSFNISWQTWIIIILILALLGINIFAYLAKGTEETVSIFSKIFTPILNFFGLATLTTVEQTIETGATGTKAGVDIVADTAIKTIDTVQPKNYKDDIPQGENVKTTLPEARSDEQEKQQWQEDTLAKALDNAKQNVDVKPDDSRSSIQMTGKSGWCYIGDERGIRTCSEIGVNDVCMSGDVFPNQAICMNPNLRA